MSAVNSLNRILQGFEPSKGKTRVMKEGLFLLLVFYILLSFRALSYVATSLGRPFISGGSTNPTSMWRMYSNTPMHPREPNFPYRTVDSSRTSSVAISKRDSATWYELRMPSSYGTCSGNTSWFPILLFHLFNQCHQHFQMVISLLELLFFKAKNKQTLAQPTPTPMSTTEVDINKLEERLVEVMNKKLESIAETLKASLFNNIENPSMASPMASPKVAQTSSGLPLPNVQDGLPVAPPVPVAPEVQPLAEIPMLSSKAKPYSRTEETMPSYTTPKPTRTTSRKRSRPQRSKDRKPSRSSRTNRRSIHRRRARSRRHHRRDHASASPGSRHQDRSLHRREAPPRPPKTGFTSGRDLSHPINIKGPSAPAAEGFRQVHTDPQDNSVCQIQWWKLCQGLSTSPR